MSRIKIKTKAQTLCSVRWGEVKTIVNEVLHLKTNRLLNVFHIPDSHSFSGLDFLQLSDTDAELRTFSWPWLKIRNTHSTLNCVILCLYWAFHLGLKSFTFSWRETFRQHRPGTWKSCLCIDQSFVAFHLFGFYVSKVWDLLRDSENDPLTRC